MNLAIPLRKNPKKEIVKVEHLTHSAETIKKKRDPANYIKAAKKNQWIKHVKKIGKKQNISYKEALKLCKINKKNR